VDEFVTLETIDEAADFVRCRLASVPHTALVLGSGLDHVAEMTKAEAVIPYADIPHFPRATAEGHAGRLVVGLLGKRPVIILQGRAHYYEGHSMAEVTLPIRVLQALGVTDLIVTNAAGGLNHAFRPGDVMIIRDHINLIGMAGLNPLRGPNLDRFGPRFPDMSQAYDPSLCALAASAAAQAGIPFHEGVYLCLAGPSYETPADIRFLRMIGADAVGMSTVPEVTVARHGGMRVLGLSGISNVAADDSGAKVTHREVLEMGRTLSPRLGAIVREVLERS